MNVLISSAILALASIFLVDSINELRPHNERKKKQKRKTGQIKKGQTITRAKSSVFDLHMTDLRKGGISDAQ